MKIIIIGAVAAGTSAAAKARRNNEDAEIVIYEKDNFISYSGCGMPYYIGGEIENVDVLTPRNPEFFKSKYNIDVKIGHEVLEIDPKKQIVQVKNLETGHVFEDSFDKLVIATGATAFKPEIDGLDGENIFFLRNIHDAVKIKNFIKVSKPKKALIVGTGFIGYEVLENFVKLGIEVIILSRSGKIASNLDEDMAKYLEHELKSRKIVIKKECSVASLENNMANLDDGTKLDYDMIIFSIGIRPNTELAKKAGLELGQTKAIKVNSKMQTNYPNIYACGDCIETFSSITKKPTYKPLGSTANKTGRIAGDSLSGGDLEYKGNLGTGIYRIFDLSVATTGLNEKEALKNGYDIEICHNIKPNKPEYLGGKEMVIKAIAHRETGRLLGVQIVGFDGVDKRIDVFATLITYGAKVDELFHLDLAYSPPFSTTKDPVHYTGMILENAIKNKRGLITAKGLKALNKKIQVVDARSVQDFEKKGSVKGAVNIPQANLRKPNLGLDKDVLTVTYCNKGVTGNAAQNILINQGFKEVLNLSGGHKFYKCTDCQDK